MARDAEGGMQFSTAYFCTPPQIIGHIEDLDHGSLRRDITCQLDDFNKRGSGWNLLFIKKCLINVVKYHPLAGSSYIESPYHLQSKGAIINVKNEDEKCFMWSVLSALFPSAVNHSRVCNYKPHINKVDFSGLKFPVTLPQIREFERQNTGFTLNVYVYTKDRDVMPAYLTKHTARPKHIDLLLLKNDNVSHFVWIKNMSRLVNSRTQHKGSTYVCPHCCHPWTSSVAFERHFPNCSQHTNLLYILGSMQWKRFSIASFWSNRKFQSY
jgi:hypothetical protein